MSESRDGFRAWLSAFLVRNGGVAGTVHVRRSELLELVAALNVPPAIREVTAHIPRGKGMAGLAWERGAVVQTCNLQQDTSGDVQPGARAVDAKAALAVPVPGASGETRAVVGIAFADERALRDDEVARIALDCASLPDV